MAYFSPRATWMSLMEPPDSISFQEEGDGGSIADLEAFKVQRDLRHRLFFHHKEWEFGPALLEDTIRLARAQSRPEEAVTYYEEARFTAKLLVEKYGEAAYVPAWLEVNRVLSEIHNLQDEPEKSVFYAREGLLVLKKGRFDPDLDPIITKLAVRFWDLLGRMPV